ncbi:MAG: acetyl-CoA carboxylase biotin carboxyl carrier protein [Actinomycetota bacterium]|nr:acetyl-CoA carboxylase biotin carboxyl carrier protein [Actinomycetota bacterium]
MELDEIKALLDLLKDTDITEFQIEKEGSKVKIRRGRFFTQIDLPRAAEPGPAAPQIKMGEEEDTRRLITVTAPLVGTFYRASSPDAPSFAEMGARVKKGQVLCIIEAMKLMNEIESEVEGVIARILVENGQPVEYGEPLFLIEPAGPDA